ncbi:GlyGly-CTERM sorting domain-containing protein [Alloalcanivorax marinus]|uniref:GlyGly-CTERM sorting domain-containing protein n=1 Tax=Alloalcanivorax marinus TaxID=1177169 RepID=UPI001933D98E|nr:GlyGly-CTERM sorting domain-containing protein [Alloalcanivorax marinus]MBL7249449.1 GlyGly-CTERM sorting domain-containing protein [Alloalcanivorax marinus]
MSLPYFRRAPLAAAVSLVLAAPAGGATDDTLTLRALSGSVTFTGFDLAATPDGFVAVWAEHDDSAQDRLMARRYDDEGLPLDDAFLVHEQASSRSMGRPSVAADQSGNLVVGWESSSTSQFPEECGGGLHFTRVSADDAVAEPAVPYQNYVMGACALDVAMDDDGDFLVTWTSVVSGQPMEQLGLRPYMADGTPISDQVYRYASTNGVRLGHASLQGEGAVAIAFHNGGQTQLLRNSSINLSSDQYSNMALDNDADFGDGVIQSGAIIARDREGGFVGAWRQHAPDAEAGEAYSLRAQRWAADGSAGDALLLAAEAEEGFSKPGVATNAAGQMVAVWSYQPAGQAPEAGAIAFDANGQRLGELDWEFADLAALGTDGAPRVALNGTAALVAWYGADGQTLEARSLNVSDAQGGGGDDGGSDDGGSGGGGGGGTTGLLSLLGLGLLALRRRVRR